MKKVVILLVAIMLLTLTGCASAAKEPAVAQANPTAAPTAPVEAAPEVQTTQEPVAEPAQEETSAEEAEAPAESSIDPELRALLESYEEFVDEYVAFMEEYNKNPTDMNLLLKSTSMAQTSLEFAEKVEAYDPDDMSTEDALYYSEVCLRCSEKLLKAIG